MPTPTNPACNGSCPEPPPETSATLPGFSCLRRTNLCVGPRVRMSSWAATRPSRLSLIAVSGPLMSFLIVPSRFHEGRHLLDELHDGFVEGGVPLLVAQVRHQEVEMAGLVRRAIEVEAL